jgi:hypothetical protein
VASRVAVDVRLRNVLVLPGCCSGRNDRNAVLRAPFLGLWNDQDAADTLRHTARHRVERGLRPPPLLASCSQHFVTNAVTWKRTAA